MNVAVSTRTQAAVAADHEELLDGGHLLLHYQPIVDLRSGHVLGVELLARIADGEQIIFPAGFLPKLSLIARRNMLFSSLDEGLAVLARCRSTDPAFSLSINVDSSVMSLENFAADVAQATKKFGIEPGSIELEILEGGEFRSLDTAREQILELRSRGFTIALDDVGSAYSSLMRLKELPIDAVKLDQGFVRSLNDAPEDLLFVYAVMCLARGLRKRLVVEGVETLEILDAMRVMDVQAAQGYAIARPMGAERLFEWLSTYVPVPATPTPTTLLGAYASHLSEMEACRALSNQPLKSAWIDHGNDPHDCAIGRFFDESGLHETEFGIAHKQFHAALPCYETDREAWERGAAQVQQTLRDAIRQSDFRFTADPLF